jgi:DNA polymerase IIIc chi subunit
MNDGKEKEIQTAWEIWNRINRLNDLLWERYEESFLQIYLQEEEEKFLRTISAPTGEEQDPSVRREPHW